MSVMVSTARSCPASSELLRCQMRQHGRHRRSLMCACETRHEAVAVGRERIAAPSDMLIRANKRKTSSVAAPQALIGQREHLHRNMAFCGCGEELVRRPGVATGDQQSEAVAEMIIKR